MTSKEALERIKLHKYIKCKECDETMLKGCRCCNNELKNSEEFETIEKDLEEKETAIKVLVEVLQNTSKENETNDKYTYMDASGAVQECDIGERLGVANLGIKNDPNGLTISTINADFPREIIIDTDSVTFRIGEFELKLIDNILTDELKHTNKIIINGISFIKED